VCEEMGRGRGSKRRWGRGVRGSEEREGEGREEGEDEEQRVK